MLRIDRTKQSLVPMEVRTFGEAGMRERDDLQRLIRQNPDAFFKEMGEELLLVGEEVRPTDVIDVRIDLLALDQTGSSVVIELKRGSDRYQLLQALTYAAMIAEWEGDQFIDQFARCHELPEDGARERVEAFVGDLEALNESQRVILMAERFDYGVLATARWLTEAHGMDVRCYELILAEHDGGEYLSCSCVYPASELRDHAARRSRRTGGDRRAGGGSRWPDWESALATCANPAVVEFFTSALAEGQENYLPKKLLYYRIDGTRQFRIQLSTAHAYVIQFSRFADDETFWRERLGDQPALEPLKDKKWLRFHLREERDFERFRTAVSEELGNTRFDV